jgi:hypothetical protein
MTKHILSLCFCGMCSIGTGVIAVPSIAADGLELLLAPEQPTPKEKEQSGSRLPPPTPNLRRESTMAVKEIFGGEMAAAKSAEQRSALAKNLLSHAASSSVPADRWVLFSDAMRLASEAGDLESCRQAVRQFSAVFEVDECTLMLEGLTRLAAKSDPADLESVARAAIELSQDSDHADVSPKSLLLAASIARKTANKQMVAEITKLQQQQRDMAKLQKEAGAIREKLASNSNDRETCLEAGEFFCFKMNDWQRGLPLLVKGSDESLASLAQADLAAETNMKARTSVADAWWDWGNAQKPPTKNAALSRAARLYELTVAEASGLERARMEKRISQARADDNGDEKRLFLADLKEARVQGVNVPFSRAGTYADQPIMCGNKTWPKALVVIPFNEARVAYAVPKGARRLIGKVGVFTPAGQMNQPKGSLRFSILVDGSEVWSSDPLTRRDETTSFNVGVAQASEIELVTKCSDPTSAWMAFLDPGFTE